MMSFTKAPVAEIVGLTAPLETPETPLRIKPLVAGAWFQKLANPATLMTFPVTKWTRKPLREKQMTGVVALQYKRRVLFSMPLTLKTSALPRRLPRVQIEDWMLETGDE